MAPNGDRMPTTLGDASPRWPVRISLPKLPPKCVDRLSDGRGTLQCRFLENASSSLFVLFGPKAVQSQERLRFFDPVRQIHVDDRIRAWIAGEGARSSSALADNQGRAPWLPRVSLTLAEA